MQFVQYIQLFYRMYRRIIIINLLISWFVARRLFNEEHPLKILVDSTEEDRFSKLVLRDNTDGSIQVLL